MTGFVDIHSHFVYGLDDGARTRADMETMLDAAHADGVVSLFATPHITPGVKPFDEEKYNSHLREARAYCRERGYRMQLFTGAEILYTPMLKQHCSAHRLPTLGDSDFVLVEFVPDVPLRELEDTVDMLNLNGYTPVLAHIERYACMFQGSTAAKLKERYKLRYQVNANTVLNKQSFLRERKIRKWFEAQLVDFVASDAHNVKTRKTNMCKAYEVLKEKYGQRQAELLTGLR